MIHLKVSVHMDYRSEDIKIKMEEALVVLAEERGNEIVDRLRPILYTNLDRGRVQGFLDSETYGVRDYVWRVDGKYTHLNPFITRLQREKSSDVWEPLLARMQSWAYHYFTRKNIDSAAAQEIARDCAVTAATFILKAYFPYDTDFDPWAHVIVQNSCRKYVREATKKSVVPQQSIVNLSDALDILEDPAFQDQEYYYNLRQDISEALAQLSGARRQVIELVYFDGLSFSEIALKMNKSVSAIYSLHFNALYELRRILSSDEEKVL